MTNIELFKRLLPEDQAAFFVLSWETCFRKSDGKFQHNSAAFRTLLELAEASVRYATALPVRNLYFCVSPQREADMSRTPPRAIRNVANTTSIKALHLDVDVKPGAYASTGEAMRALIAACVAIGLPSPTIVIYSAAPVDGSPVVDSGFHAHWVLDRPLTVERWRPVARAFSAALRAQNLRFDLNVPTNPCCILRPPGSFNRKYNPQRIARLDPHVGSDCGVDAIRAVLAHAQPPGVDYERSRVRDTDADFGEILDAVEYLTTRGHYDRGRYNEVLALHFALAHLVNVKPDLLDDARDLIRCVVAGTGRDLAVNESRFNDALTRTADRLTSDDALTTPASLFRAAYQAGWSPARDLGSNQRSALARARRQLRFIFDEGHDRAAAAMQAARLVERIRDPRVGSALAPSMARRLARDGWSESEILSVIEGLSARPDAGLVRWAMRRGSEA